MGIVTSILDALRRQGRPTQRSALRRLDQQLDGQVVLERGRNVARSELGLAEQFTARVQAYEQRVTPLSGDELGAIESNAALAFGFAAAFGVHPSETLSLDDLDATFANWLASEDQKDYDSRAVVELLGAAFGMYCVTNLDMRWVTVEDSQGTAIAVQGRKTSFFGFPYHSIEKRIAAGETGFFRAVYIGLQDAAGQDFQPTP